MTPIDEAEALYKTMNVLDLVILRHAFVADRDGGDETDKTFCQGRIDAITRELTARHQRVLAVLDDDA